MKEQKVSKQMTEIYTDGACSGNPGPGGWGVLLRHGDIEKELCGGEEQTTNNRMELMAVIKALMALKKSCVVTIHTDSKYVHDGISVWLAKWKKNNWRTSNKKPVKNQDLWEELDHLEQKFEVHWKWVKGHNNHPENDRADGLARLGMQPFLKSKKDE
jgi:ribonuclease HI